MKNPKSHQASSGFEQTFLPDSNFTPNQCPKFLGCNSPVCPLDVDWKRRVLINEDSTCFYLTESVKHSAESVFQGAGLERLYTEIVRVCPAITERHPRIRKALERAKLSGSRMTRSITKGGKIK